MQSIFFSRLRSKPTNHKKNLFISYSILFQSFKNHWKCVSDADSLQSSFVLNLYSHTLTTLVPSAADTKKKGRLCFEANLKFFRVTFYQKVYRSYVNNQLLSVKDYSHCNLRLFYLPQEHKVYFHNTLAILCTNLSSADK